LTTHTLTRTSGRNPSPKNHRTENPFQITCWKGFFSAQKKSGERRLNVFLNSLKTI
jgi:hypothetical protein